MSSYFKILVLAVAALVALAQSANAVTFSIDDVKCGSYDVELSLTQAEWSASSYAVIYIADPNDENTLYDRYLTVQSDGEIQDYDQTYTFTFAPGNKIPKAKNLNVGVFLTDSDRNVLTQKYYTVTNTCKGKVPVAAIAGGVVGCLVLLGAVAAFVLIKRKRRNAAMQSEQAQPGQYTAGAGSQMLEKGYVNPAPINTVNTLPQSYGQQYPVATQNFATGQQHVNGWTS